MRRLNNKGFSLIEIIIAVAVFSILVYPITNAIVMSTKTTTTSRKKQYAVEKAEEIMERFKTSAIDVTSDNKVYIPNDNSDITTNDDGYAAYDSDSYKTGYEFTKDTTKSSAVKAKSVKLPDGAGSVNYTSTVYSCPDVSIGNSYATYTCEVTVDDSAYQVMTHKYILMGFAETEDEANELYDGVNVQQDDGSYAVFKKASNGAALKTDVTDSGVVRTLDSSSQAVIVGATYSLSAEGRNLDNQAYQYFKDAKMDALKDNAVLYSQAISSSSDIFSDDYFDKTTTISISKKNDTYTVKCIVEYVDHTSVGWLAAAGRYTNTYLPPSSKGEGVVYSHDYEGELPPIYLAYVPATYNGSYCQADSICVDIDTSVPTTDKEEIYIFKTVTDINSKYNDYIVEGAREVFEQEAYNEAYEKAIQEGKNEDVAKTLGNTAKTTAASLYANLDIDDLTYTSEGKLIQSDDVKVRVNKKSGTDSALYNSLSLYANFDIDTANSDLSVSALEEDESDAVYMYNINVKLIGDNGSVTEVTGTKGASSND